MREIRKRHRGRLLLLATLVAGATVAVFFVASSGAAPVGLSGSPFEGKDGNMVVDASGKTDWATFAPPVLRLLQDAPSGSTDDAFTQGTHEDDPNVTIAQGSIPPNKNDLTRAYAVVDPTPTDNYLYLAWERAVNTGSANLDFELNQNPTPNWTSATTGAVTINRTEGDILITYDFGGSGTPDLGLLTWLTDGHGHANSDCEASGGKLPCWGNRVDLIASQVVPQGEAGVNTSPIQETVLNTQLGAGLFGEAKIDLTLIPGLFSPNTCTSYGSLFVKSRSSGSSIDAELKDFIAPQPLHVSNCASLKVVKNTNGGNGQFSFSSTGGLGGDSNNGNFSITTAGGSGSDTFGSLQPGAYSVTENAPPSGWQFTSAVCKDDLTGNTVGSGGATQSLNLLPDQSVTCTYTNTKLAQLKVVKHTAGGDASFPFDGSTGPFSLQTSGGTASQTFPNLAPGAFGVTEGTLPAGWSFMGASCVDDANQNPIGNASGQGITGSLSAGQSVTCTFNNAKQGQITVVKNTVGGNGTFSYTSDKLGGGAFQIQTNNNTGQSVFGSLNPGSYSVTESGPPSGWLFTSLACADDSSHQAVPGVSGMTATISLAAGQQVTCTYTNTKQAHLTLVKHVSNTHGGTAAASDFTLGAAGPTPISGAGGASGDVNAGSYTLSDSSLAGYTKGTWSCSGGTFTAPNTIALAAGQSATCEITNSDNAPALHLRKVVVNDNGGTKTATDWTLHADGPSPLNGTTPVDSDAGFKAGTYNLSETGPSGYTASDWVCTGDGTQNGASITLGLGQSATCTITNNDNPPALHLRKVVINDNGGTKSATDWTLSAAGPTPLSGQTPVDSDATFKAGTYNLSETGPSGYTASAWVCTGGSQSGSSITVGLGESATCTITNDDNAPKLHLRKIVVNNNGGTKTAADWTLNADGPTPLNGQTPVDSGAGFKAGTYNLSETGPGGYTASAWSCTGGTQDGASITLGLGQEATCTITNDDNPPALHLRKVVVNDNGGTKTAADWTLNAAGPTPLNGATPVDSGSTFKAGTYTLSESGPSGYTASAWSCDGGTQSGDQITVGLGESATCTITNDDNAPKLHLRKIVVNNNGGTKTATDWTLSAAGPSPLSGQTPVDSGAGFKAGTYNLSETGPGGYTASAWSCSGGTQDGASITLGVGQEATCTITNDDNPPGLHLRKVVVNDNGGTAVATDWTLNAAGSTPLTGKTPVDSGAGFEAGTYTLSESGPSGYTASAWVCDGGTLDGNKITVGLGESATCTITNNDDAPALHLRKVVVNDNGGTKTATDWTLSAAGPSPLSGTTPVDSGAGFKAGTYNLSETGPDGYTASAWVCTGGGNQNGASITLGLGESATCTITNDDNAPKLHLRKIVVNNDGGSKTAADWTLSAAGPSPLSGATPVDSGAGFKAGTYSLAETGPGGYTASAWQCVGGTQNGSSITLALGQEATCTITNDDQTPQLKLVKNVVNDDGGSATAADWTLHASADGARDFTSATASPTFHDVFAGATYALSETGGPDGYSSNGQWTCDGGTLNEAKTAVTVALGAHVTCSITNNDNSPQLKLVKHVVNDNGGTATAGDWTLKATAESPKDGRNFTSASSEPAFHNVFGGVSYTLSETGGPAGYSSNGEWTCDGGTLNEAKTAVTVGLGHSATCTITNDDIAPTITIQKRLVPTNDAGTFDFTIDSTVLNNGGQGYGNLGTTGEIAVSAGSHTVKEAGHGSTATGAYTSTWSCSNEHSGAGTTIEVPALSLDQHIVCTFTNTRLATLIVKKVVDNSNGGGSKTPGDFTLHVTQGGIDVSGSPAPGSATGTTYSGLLPGTYKVSEGAVSGYSLTGISGCLADGSIVLEAGQTATCTLTNTSAAPPPPPPPPPPAPKIDLSITKSGAPSPQTVTKNITWTMVVTNNGPNDATGVTVADPIPSGTSFVSASSSQGTCTGGAILSCSIGAMKVGTSVTITLVTTANVTGTIPNTATVVGNEAETNTANNTASASVQIVGKFVPPPVYCTALAVTPKQLSVGKKSNLRIKVTQHGKAAQGVKVLIKGSSLYVVTKPSNHQGVVQRSVLPKKAGIVTFVPVAGKRCNAPRVGVIPVFTPPVTG